MKSFLAKIAFFILFVATAYACTSSNKADVSDNEVHTEGIYLTQQQFETENMQIGRPTGLLFQSGIHCNGIISAQPNGLAQINAIIPGRVEAVYAVMGQHIQKGERIALLSSSDLIELQQQYGRTLGLKKKLTADYERAKDLFDSKIGSEKEFLMVESEYLLVMADYNALRLQLKRLQLDVEAIGKGNIVDTYPLISPIDGELTQLNVVLGDYVELEENIAEVVNSERIQLRLSVFEKDLSDLKTGSQVVFHQLNHPQSVYTAQLTSIAKRVQDDTKTITCLASIDSLAKREFIYKSYVQAQIITRQKQALGLPEQAIVKQGDEQFYFVVQKQDEQGYYLQKKKAVTGESSKGHIEVHNAQADEQVVLTGVYNLPVD